MHAIDYNGTRMGLFSAPKHLHLVGIKGQGMTALAQVLAQRGHKITGSDVPEVFTTDAVLEKLHIRVATTFSAKNVPPMTNILIHSAAFGPTNPEIKEATARGIRVMVYPEALGELSKDQFAVGVAGMHGKTTTTAMLGIVLTENGMDPTVIVGSRVTAFGDMNARIGEGKVLVAETCEYRRHFLHFSPNLVILTNVEAEHLDYFHDLEDIEDAYLEYIERLTPWKATAREHIDASGRIIEPVAVPAVLVACLDDAGVRALLPRIVERFPEVRVVTYGLDAGADCRATQLRMENRRQVFDVEMNGNALGAFQLAVPGTMNVLNALASIATTFSLPTTVTGVVPTVRSTRQALASFQGTTRRFQIRGEARGITVVDDYAHHPSEIRATLQAARQFYPRARIFADFMGHTFSRTKALLADFGTAFSDANVVYVNRIYPSARELPDPTISGEILATEIATHHKNVIYVDSFEDTAQRALNEMKPGDLFITLGAGDNWRIGEMVLGALNEPT